MDFTMDSIARVLRNLAESIEHLTCERCGCLRVNHKGTGCIDCDCRTAYGYEEAPRRCVACNRRAVRGQKVCAMHGGRRTREERPV
jgi:hypothetical protein